MGELPLYRFPRAVVVVARCLWEFDFGLAPREFDFPFYRYPYIYLPRGDAGENTIRHPSYHQLHVFLNNKKQHPRRNLYYHMPSAIWWP